MTRVYMNSSGTLFFFVWTLSIANIIILLPMITSHPLHVARAIGQNIRQLPCKGKSLAAKGVCMFALDCIKSNGNHLGTCIDRFYFGSCCQLPSDTSSNNNKYSFATNKPIFSSSLSGSASTGNNNNVTSIKPAQNTMTTQSSSPVNKTTTTTTGLPNTSVGGEGGVHSNISAAMTAEVLSSSSETITWTMTTDAPSTATATTSLETVDYDDSTNTINDGITTEDVTETTMATLPSSTRSTTAILTSSRSTETPTTKTTTGVTSKATVSISTPTTSVTTTTTPRTTTENGTDVTTMDSSTTVPFDATKLAEMDYHAACGRQVYRERPTGRIVNGQKTQFGEWPWQISLRQWKRTTFMHKCGAALLNENWAITAAHCVDGVLPEDLLLRIGEFDLSSDSEPLPHVERRVQIMTIHPEFNSRTFENDLALLRFYDPVTFQANIIPTCLPLDDSNFVNKTGFVTGWGRLYVDGPLPNILQEVQVPVITNAECEQEYRKAGFLESIPDIFLCAGYDDGGRDSCEGDSGGPLVIKQSNDRWFLAGIISWGIGCAEPHQPGVYTRISKFRDWINQILVF